MRLTWWWRRGGSAGVAVSDEAIAVVKLYNDLSQFVLGGKRTVTPSAKHRSAAAQVLLWLDDHGVSVGPYLAAAFAKSGWSRQPAFSSLNTDRYQSWYFEHVEEAEGWWQSLRLELQSRQRPDLPRSLELIKARWAARGLAELCRQSPITGRYDPRSEVCAECPQRKACARG